MVRQRTRKSVEELYASKFETSQTKSVSTSHNNTNNIGNNNAKQTARTDRDYGGYIISSNTPYNTQCSSGNAQTSRRKSSARPPVVSKTEKFYTKDEKLLHLEEIKKDPILKQKTARNEKCPYAASANNNVYDNKSYVNFTESTHKDPCTHMHRDDDKDDDTEEFFELIRQTVESAIGKSISDLLNRNFRELSAKIDRFSTELKATNTHLNRLQTEINNKVVHYGEENSRHFRYLCMKSEYDKMFYQHHTMLATNTAPGVPAKGTHPPKSAPSTKEPPEKPSNSCSCSSRKPPQSEPHKTSSEDHSVSQKSSEMGMREVLEHIQRFCTQMQLNELKCDDRKGSFRIEEAMKINKQAYEEDEDDFQISSDGMTPRSDEHIPHKYGGNTMRSCSTSRGGANNGGGDA